ncbi:MAG: MerR family transcriptional regulator [Myxococcota bacterium]
MSGTEGESGPSDGSRAEPLFDPDAALQAARARRQEDPGLPPEITADLTLAARTELPLPIPDLDTSIDAAEPADQELVALDTERPPEHGDPDADGVLEMAPGGITVDPSDVRRETVDDPRIPAEKLFFKIGEVSKITGLKPYVLRYWETEFPWIRPTKTSSRQRLYRRQDIAVLLEIKRLRYEERQTIADTKERIRERRGLEREKHRRPSKAPRPRTSSSPGLVAVSPLRSDRIVPVLRDLRLAVLDLLAVVDAARVVER